MTPARTLILGATGAVGGRLAGLLVERGDEVAGLVRSRDQEKSLRDRGIRSILGDLSTLTSTIWSASSPATTSSSTAPVPKAETEK